MDRIHGACCFTYLMVLVAFLGSTLAQTDDDNPQCSNLVEKWAVALGNELQKLSLHNSGMSLLREQYENQQSDFSVTERPGEELLNDINAAFTEFLLNKTQALDRIVRSAEEAYNTFNFSSVVSKLYPNALNDTKLYNSSIDLSKFNAHYGMNVDTNSSTIHVPTVVYSEDERLLREIEATSVLDDVFLENSEKDPSLTWQYFASTIGFMRNYPGVKWELPSSGPRVNLFDARSRKWYSHAISPPKIVLFLVDVSGSQTGLAISMTRLMVDTTIDSLGDDDFFNVLTFNDTTKLLSEKNVSVHATYENKELMKGKLHEIEPQEESNVCAAFKVAFDILAKMRGDAGNVSSESIMLFTDGVEFPCDEVFDERNSNKSVRVFTYLLGELLQHARILERIACSNHGTYTRVSVKSDVVEKVSEYLTVVGRPLAQSGIHPTVWTNTYKDFQTEELTISLSQLALNQTDEGRLRGEIIGVGGLDIPIKSLTQIASPYKGSNSENLVSTISQNGRFYRSHFGVWGAVSWKEMKHFDVQFGVNGYFFMTTNNGFVTYHPRQRFSYDGQTIEGISTEDIKNIEQTLGNNTSITDNESCNFNCCRASTGQQIDTLRRNMINRKSESQKFRSLVPLEDMKRIFVLQPTYRYTPLDNTPFSLAVVLDGDVVKEINPPKVIEKTGDTIMRTRDINYAIQSLKEKDKIKLADWIPCEQLSGENVTNEDIVVAFLETIGDGEHNMTVTCDLDWINLLLLDLNITDGYVDKLELHHDVVTSFVATSSGLNWECLQESSSDRFTVSHPNTLREDYFARAVNDVVDDVEEYEQVFIYSTRLKGDDNENSTNLDTSSDVVTAYSALKVEDKVVAVAGYQIPLDLFLQIYRNTSSVSSDDGSCSLSCDSDEGVSCYLMDRHGYILASAEEYIGSHLAEADPVLFDDLLYRKIFYSINYEDQQALCQPQEDTDPDSGISLMNPFSQFKNLMVGLAHKTIFFIMTFNWYEWFSALAMPAVVSPEVETELPLDEINCEFILHQYYKVNNSRIVQAEKVIVPPADGCAQECGFTYHMFAVPNTTLVLLVKKALPACDNCGDRPEFFIKRETAEFKSNATCATPESRYRKPLDYPPLSDNVNKSLEATCGASFLQPPSWVLLAMVTFHIFARSYFDV